MGDPTPEENDNTADGINPVDSGAAERAGTDGSQIGAETTKRVSEPPPPPLLPGQDAKRETGAEKSPEKSPDLSQWLMDWAAERSGAMEEARATRKISGLDSQKPPSVAPVIEGLKRTADSGEEAPTVEPDRSDFTKPAPHGAPTPTGGVKVPTDIGPPVVPSPPPVRTPPPSPPVGDKPLGNKPAITGSWTGPSSETPVIDIRDGAGQPEVTEGDIARLARSTSTRVVSTRNLKLGSVDITFGSQRSMAVVGVFAMTLLVALMALIASGFGVDRSESTTVIGAREATVKNDDNSNFLVSGTPPAAPNVSDLARSTVRVVGLGADNEVVCVGSGVIVGAEGIILTNAHVATVGDDCELSSIGIGITTDDSQKAELLYLAETLVSDNILDLAVLRIVSPLPTAPDAPFPRRFPAVTLGDSDDVKLGDSIRILGYPVIGGQTITSTTGSVGGFSSQDGVGERAWIKTDASFSGGASGGMAINAVGEFIGIPTKAQATDDGPAVDCRPLEDTNGDGKIDTDDNCQPIGGYLNGLRPINLASDVLERAEAIGQAAGATEGQASEGQASGPAVEQSQPGAPSVDLSDVLFTNPRFSPGEEENQPVEDVVALREGVIDVCLFVDWAGLTDGVSWAAVWLVDGQQVEDFGRLDEIWDFGPKGENFWYCANDENGHEPGVYEMGLFIDNQLAFVESIQILEDDAEVFEVMWVNKSDHEICGLAVNPLADSRHVGLNELSADAVIGRGRSHTMQLAEGDIVVEAFDCSGQAIATELDGLRVPDDMFVDGEKVPFVIGGDVQAGQSDQDS